MPHAPIDRNPHCQLQVLPQGAEPMQFFDRLRLRLLRILVALEKKLGRQGYAITRVRSCDRETASDNSAARNSKGTSIEEGDWITVRSLGEIQATLDKEGRCKGLEFIDDMARHCGAVFRVKKKVGAIFDERAWKMLRIKNTFILEDCICDGRGMYDKEGCGRCCFFFWKEDWLQKNVDHADEAN